jgi:long-chain acyl-CoA synthetase
MNLASILDGHPDDAVALVSRGRTTSYGELRAQVAALRTSLVRLGIAPGDRVALLCANNWFFVVGWLAALGAGAEVVPLNPGSPAEELEAQLAETETRIVIAGPTGADAYNGVDRLAVPVEHVFVPDGSKVEAAEPIEPLFQLPADGGPVPVVDRAPDDVALLMYTAGTSGSPKAAILTHGNLLSNLEQSDRVRGRSLTPDDVCLGLLPLFHIFGLNVVLDGALHKGASVVLVERFDPVDTLRTITDHRVTVVAAAPPVYVAWATMPGADRDALRSVRIVASGAAKLPEEVAKAFEDRFDLTIAEGYGLTEASPIVTTSVGSDARFGSIGVPIPGVEVRLVDEDGEDVIDGDPGEIWVRGPNVFKGYLGDDEATRRVLTDDGWLRTGDVAVADDDGWLWLVDRRKDLVIVSGFNVYPAEVEDVLRAHPGVADAAVIGEPDPYSGERVKAFVVEEPGVHLEEEELVAYCLEHLARYKAPARVEVVDGIPRNAGGKALRRALR